MIYAPPYLIRRSVPKVKSIDHELATSPTVTPRAHKAVNTGRQTTVAHYYYEHHKIKKATQYNALRHRTYRRERLLAGSVGLRSHTTMPHVYQSSSCLATGDQNNGC